MPSWSFADRRLEIISDVNLDRSKMLVDERVNHDVSWKRFFELMNGAIPGNQRGIQDREKLVMNGAMLFVPGKISEAFVVIAVVAILACRQAFDQVKGGVKGDY